MSYTTQMDAARQGIITPEMKAVAASEHIAEDELRELIALGQVIIPANKAKRYRQPLTHQDQRKSRNFQRLDGPRHGNGKSKKCGRHGRRSNHGLEFLWRHTEIPPQADE